MTPGNDGASTPEDDDPFGYLYADGQASGAVPPSGGGYGYGYPGPRSYNRVHTVGERQYGQSAAAAQQAAPAYGRQAPQQYGTPNPHYASPEALGADPSGPRTRAAARQDSGGGRGRGPNTRGLLIGAVAVLAAVVIGIGVAVATGGGEDDKAGGGEQTESPAEPQDGGDPKEPGKPKDDPAPLPKAQAKTLKLEGGTVTAADIPGAKSGGGYYVTGFNQVGAKATWKFSAKEAGDFRLYVRYSVPGVPADATVVVNGKKTSQALSLDNFAESPEGDWEKGWQTTWASVNLNKGTNYIELVCAEGNQCNALIDTFEISKGKLKG